MTEIDDTAAEAVTRLRRLATTAADADTDKADTIKRIVSYLRGPYVEALARCEAADLEAAAELMRLASVRGYGGHAKRVERAIRQARINLSGARVAAAVTGGAALVLRGLDLPSTVSPGSWEVTDGGVYHVRPSGGDLVRARVTHRPMVVSGLMRDLDDPQRHHLVISWPDVVSRRWVSTVVERSAVMDSRRLVAMSSQGAPVDSGNSRRVVEYLSAFEAANSRSLPVGYVTRRMGWCGDSGELGYLLGRDLIQAPGPDRARVQLVGDSAGRAQIVDGYRSRGTLRGWLRAVGVVRHHPRVMLALYAALVPPLLGIIEDAPNFIVDWSGTSSSGKTTTLRVAASVWGSPDERSGGVMHTWDATAVYVERVSELGQYLPLILDDTKRSQSPDHVGSVLYQVASGRGRGRGSVDGLRASASWRTVLLSTGEAPAVSYTQEQGSRARTLSICGAPFGSDAGSVVEGLTLSLLDHHGHAGEVLIGWLTRHRDRWPELRETYRRYRDEYGARAESEFGRRSAPYLALLRMAAGFAHNQIGLPEPEGDQPLDVAYQAAQVGALDADRPMAAMRALYEWSVGHRRRYDGGGDRQSSPPEGWAGAWRRSDDWDRIAILPAVAAGVLSGLGYDVETVVTDWSARGWLEGDQGRRTTRVHVGMDRVRAYMVTRATLIAVGAAD